MWPLAKSSVSCIGGTVPRSSCSFYGVQLDQAIREFLAVHNDQPELFIGTKGADQILASIARFCQHTRRGVPQS
jgi:hypothetical protein